MPLDFNLLKKSIEYSTGRINACTATPTSHLFLVNDFLHKDLLEKILYCESVHSIKWETSQDNYNNSRQASVWQSDTVIEEINIVMEGLTESIKKLTNNHDLYFGSSYLWKDTKPYKIGRHSDRNLIKASIQIYLNHTDAVDLSTQFIYNQQIIKPTYKKNCGYISNNLAKVDHWMTNDIPENFERLSLYSFWK